MPVKLLFEAKQQQQQKNTHTLNKQDKAGVVFPPNFDLKSFVVVALSFFFKNQQVSFEIECSWFDSLEFRR